jgi:hypothetical protein
MSCSLSGRVFATYVTAPGILIGDDKMGMAKRELERRWELDLEAASVARQAGAIKACPRHEEVSIDQFDSDAVDRAYAIATNKWKAGEIRADSREELMDAIKDAIDEAGDTCYICENDSARD